MPRYFTGKPCRNGHVAERYVNDGRCVQCKAEKDARSYAKHADKRRAAVLAHYSGIRDARILAMRDYHARKKGDPAYQAVRAAYKEKHDDRLRLLAQEKRATPEARAAKAAKKRADAHLYRAYEQTRNARKRNAIPSWYGELDDFALREAAALIDARRVATGIDWQLDHMIPIGARKACGLHCAANFQVIPRTLNARKNNQMLLTAPGAWIKCLDIAVTCR